MEMPVFDVYDGNHHDIDVEQIGEEYQVRFMRPLAMTRMVMITVLDKDDYIYQDDDDNEDNDCIS